MPNKIATCRFISVIYDVFLLNYRRLSLVPFLGVALSFVKSKPAQKNMSYIDYIKFEPRCHAMVICTPNITYLISLARAEAWRSDFSTSI